ncbi:MAG: hypothetical protein LBQ80_05665 [Clostridium sp.]|jgi:hypothetical protein|nr:hypothetical protein [Clostridium sp.]
MKKLLSVLLVLALIILPLAAVVTSASAVIAATTALRMIESGGKTTTSTGTTTETTTAPPAAEDTTAAPAAEDTTEAPAAEDTTEAPVAEDTTAGTTAPVATTAAPSGNTTTTAAPTKVTTTAAAKKDAVAAYAEAVKKTIDNGKSVKVTQVTSMGDFTGDEGMIKLTDMNFDRISPGLGTIGSIVKGFLGEGTVDLGTGKPSEKLSASTLTAADVKSSSQSGDKITINIVDKVNPTPKTGAIGNVTTYFPYESNVREEIDIAVKDSLKGLAKVNIDGMTFSVKNTVLTATVGSNGQLSALTIKFDFNARLEGVNIKILSVISLGSGEWGEVNGTRTLTFSNFS